ncbi:hypothetical protein GCM10022234_24640 [Aeromicrobium panaciterrae]|uniref:hypothetical protein n=1 Tax=Aeromicrobium panaciterrae TaxID=363861 RepID=UPI0031DCA0CD
MIAVVTVLLAFPLGFFVRSHLNANVAYAIAYLWAFTYQGVALIREWVGGDTSAFPKDPDTVPVSYGLVAAAIFAVGFGLVALGRRVGAKRREQRPVVA